MSTLPGMANEHPVLEEAMDNLREAAQRIRVTQNVMHARGTTEDVPYRELLARLSTALAMTGALYVEARRRRGGVSALPDPIRRGWVCRAARSLGTFVRPLVDHHSIHHLFLRYRRHIGL